MSVSLRPALDALVRQPAQTGYVRQLAAAVTTARAVGLASGVVQPLDVQWFLLCHAILLTGCPTPALGIAPRSPKPVARMNAVYMSEFGLGPYPYHHIPNLRRLFLRPILTLGI